MSKYKVLLANCLSGQQVALEKGIDNKDIVYCDTLDEVKNTEKLVKSINNTTAVITDYFGLLPEDDFIKFFYTDQNLLSISRLGELAKRIISIKERSYGIFCDEETVKNYASSMLKLISDPSLPFVYMKKIPWAKIDDLLFMRCWRVLKGFDDVVFHFDNMTVVWQAEHFYKKGYTKTSQKNIQPLDFNSMTGELLRFFSYACDI